MQTKEEKKCNPHSCNKLNVFNELQDLPYTSLTPDIVEVRFKNTRKGFYRNIHKLPLKEGDMVAVEASPGHDIGTVSLTGELVREQMKKKDISPHSKLRSVYRKVRPTDIEKWEQAVLREDEIMLKAKRISKSLNLKMKIGDVEFQGDGNKAIFYYIADHRVDFRELIKILADEFKIRVEMRQIGARQEAGRIGGIGSCGREICCSSWMTRFVSVATDRAREQQLAINPQKLTGQCGKLKCCLNFESEGYKEAASKFPPAVDLETKDGKAYFMKMDIYKETIWYSFSKDCAENVTAVNTGRVFEIIEMNKKGILPGNLRSDDDISNSQSIGSGDILTSGSITRFDHKRSKRRPSRKRRKRKSSGNTSEKTRSQNMKKKDEKNNLSK
ncbi:MAG: hypothetical protein CSB06_00265 [Bacteroidia bacterium]|nr:MAG: hypothetical protein CSB06_00265 [Bacteroidia bacterium]